MMNLNKRQRSNSGLAHALGQPSPSLVQNCPVSLVPQNIRNATSQLEPQVAITILLDEEDENIFAYLRFARSLDQNLHYFPDHGPHGPLSSDQVRAVWALRACADDEIRAWLEQHRKLVSESQQPVWPQGGLLEESGPAYLSTSGQARGIGHSPGDWALRDFPAFRKLLSDTQQPIYSQGRPFEESGRVHLSTSGQARGIGHTPSDRASVCASPNNDDTESSYQGTLNAPRTHPRRTLDRTDTSHEGRKPANLYRCTICEDRRSYKNLSDWRKHEKEHVERYVCMRGGPLEETKGGVKCILCGFLNPSQEHLSAHNIQICGQGVPGSFSCKRRVDLVSHLSKRHNVQGKAQGEAIANRWKETTKNKMWSCGFCVHLVHTFGDRLKHIATHFARGQTFDEWDTTKVMEGLLSQPGMVDAWVTRLDHSYGLDFPEIIWKKHAVKELQHDLEIGPSDANHAAALAKAAYEASQSRWHSLNDDKPLAFAPTDGAPETRATVWTNDYELNAERAFKPSSNHNQPLFVADPAKTLHYGVPALRGTPMDTYDYGAFPTSFSDYESGSIEAPGLSDHGQTYWSAPDQHTGFNGYQEHSNATAGSHNWPTSALFDYEPDDDDI